jgi:peptide/nickel transport system permease protein
MAALAPVPAASPAAVATVAAAPRRSRFDVLRAVLASRSGQVGLAILTLQVVVALAAPVIAPYDPTEPSAALRLQPPSPAHPFGTDALGRDVLSRTLWGGRVVLGVTVVAGVVAAVWASAAGLALGFLGGKLDEIAMRAVDALLAIPWTLFLLIVVSLAGGDLRVLVAVLAFFYGLPAIRVVRAACLALVARDHVRAASARGHTAPAILRAEILPNALDTILVEGAIQWSWMILGFSSLAFLGFGVAPPTPDWGVMIGDNRTTFGVAPWATMFPLVALSLLVIGINLAADAVAKAMGVDRARGAPA